MRRTIALLAVLLLPAVASAQTVVITSSITTNTTWGPTGDVVGDIFWVQANIQISPDDTLTIQPGVIVKFGLGTIFTVSGVLTAQGAPGNEIIFTSIRDDEGGDTNGDGNSTVPAAANWYGLRFPDAAPDGSLLDYCDVRYAGTSATGGLVFTSNSSTVSNSVIRACYYGVDCQGSASPTLDNTTIEASTQTPITLDFTATPVLSSLVFSSANNGYDAFGLRGGALATAATLPQRGATVGASPISNVTYVLFSTLTVNSTGSLTVDPGVVIKPVSSSTSIVVQSGGNLTMNGTAAAGDTITITSISDDNIGLPGDTNNNGSGTAPAPNDWDRIVFQDGSTGSIDHVRLKFGTSQVTEGMIEMVNRSIPVSNTLLSDASHGLALFSTSNPNISNVDINNCTSTPVLMSVAAAPTFANIGLTANAITAIGLEGEPIGVDSRIALRSLGGYTNITYYIMNGPIVMNSPAVLTIDPGIVIKSQQFGGGITVNGALVADGKPDSMITFTSERDDAYGNPADTNGDGAATSPAVGNWDYIEFGPTSDDGICVLDYCRITYGSEGPFGNQKTSCWIRDASPTVTNTVITHGVYAIRIDGASQPTIDMCDINNCTGAPLLMSVVSDPNITVNNVYSTNGYNALALLNETIAQDARIKYRPGVGSPTFAYLPIGTITVGSGVTLSIDPQVTIKPSGAFDLFVVGGALNVVGSDNGSGRVVFTSRRDDNPNYGGDTTPTDATTPQAGDWGSIRFTDSSVDAQCVVRNVLFQFGAFLGDAQGVLTTEGASPTLSSLSFFQNESAMTFKGNSAPVIDSTEIFNCTELPLAQSLVSNPQFPNPANITLANNTWTAFGLLGETVAQNVATPVRSLGTFDNLAYVPTGTITIAFGATWTIAPGVVIKLGRALIDPFGVQIDIDGALVADGKPESLIVFTTTTDDAFGGDLRSDGALTTPAAGQWNGIYFDPASDDLTTVIDHVRLRYAGRGNWGALYIDNASPTVTNTYSSINANYGVLLQGDSAPTFTDCKFDSSLAPIRMSLVSNPTFTNVEFLGNVYTALDITPEAIAQDLLWPIRAVSGRSNMPYLLRGTLTTGLGATVTLQPGLIVKSQNGAIRVQRAFVAEGKTDSQIVFTSYRDDFYGGDTNNDGTDTSPASGNWDYVWVDGTAIDPEVRFLNCIFRYGGAASSGALRCLNSSPSVDSCTFAYNDVGVSAEGASNPVIHGSSLYGNTNFAVNNTGGSFCVDAQGNWWGDASGPNDASATADLCVLGANAGLGDAVSNDVDYTGWVTGGVQTPLLGDVSLNGEVRAYDASLVLQSAAVLIALTPLQELVADVSGTAGVTAFDASLILQYVANLITVFPAASTGAQQAPPDVLAVRALVARAVGNFDLELGDAYRNGDEWVLPVQLGGTAPAYSLELLLEGASAGELETVSPRDANALHVLSVEPGSARVALAGIEPQPEGEVLLLRFRATGEWESPQLAWARVNETELASSPVPDHSTPVVSFAARPYPNPASSPVRFSLGIAMEDAGGPARVAVYDVSGRVVRVLHEGVLPAGVHDFRWDLTQSDGRRLSPGIYLVRSKTQTLDETHRVVVVR